MSKTVILVVICRVRDLLWRIKSFSDLQCQFPTRNKSFEQRKQTKISMTSECVRNDLILPWGAGVPVKMSTRGNVHLTILRQRILIRRQNSPVKRSRENVHQPRIWTPNSLHFAHDAVHFAHGGQNLFLNFDCRSDWFWGFCTLPDQSLPRHKTSVLIARLFHLVLSSNFRLSKEMHTI